MVIIQVLDEPYQYAACVVYVRFVLNLELFFIWLLQELLLEDVFFVHHLLPLVHLGLMLLGAPWEFFCRCIDWNWSVLNLEFIFHLATPGVAA